VLKVSFLFTNIVSNFDSQIAFNVEQGFKKCIYVLLLLDHKFHSLRLCKLNSRSVCPKNISLFLVCCIISIIKNKYTPQTCNIYSHFKTYYLKFLHIIRKPIVLRHAWSYSLYLRNEKTNPKKCITPLSNYYRCL